MLSVKIMKGQAMDSHDASQCPTVLIIEDDPGHLRLLELMLGKAGCVCDCARDGREGLAKAESNRYDLIFIDIHIPELDGFVVVTDLRDKRVKTPIIAVTALVLEGVEQLAIQAGFDDFLRKPIEQVDVTRIIDKYLHSDAV